MSIESSERNMQRPIMLSMDAMAGTLRAEVSPETDPNLAVQVLARLGVAEAVVYEGPEGNQFVQGEYSGMPNDVHQAYWAMNDLSQE